MKFAYKTSTAALVAGLVCVGPAATAAAANGDASRDVTKSAKRQLQTSSTEGVVGLVKYPGASGADSGVESEVTANLEEDDQVTGEKDIDRLLLRK